MALVAHGTVALLGLGVAFVIWEMLYVPSPDRTDQSYAPYADVFKKLRHDAETGEANGERSIDFSQRNGGAWKRGCLFGGYSSPLTEMEALGRDRERGGPRSAF